MARCFQCNFEITYAEMFLSVFSHIRRNIGRRALPIFNCPHCHTECQESSVTAYGFLGFVICSIFLCEGLLRRAGESVVGHPLFLVGFILAYFGLHVLWWRRVSTTKEPYLFFGRW